MPVYVLAIIMLGYYTFGYYSHSHSYYAGMVLFLFLAVTMAFYLGWDTLFGLWRSAPIFDYVYVAIVVAAGIMAIAAV